MVTDAERNGFGPVCEYRGNQRIYKWQWYVFVVFMLLFIIQSSLTFSVDFYFLAGASSSILLAEGIRRCCLFAEEYHHTKTRYKGSTFEAFQACLSLPHYKCIISGLLIASLAYWWQSPSSFPILPYVMLSILFSICGRFLDIHRITEVEVSLQNEMLPQARNISAGAAWSYYHYLQTVLPELHTTFERAKGPEFCIDGIDIRNVITDMSLFIVIPKDGNCPALKTVDERIRFRENMPELKVNKGAVMERVYKNSLYEVSIEDKEPKYVIIEYATPLTSFKKMVDDANVDFTHEEMEREIVQFYLRLKHIIGNDAKCSGRCKFILTGPATTNGINNERRMADIIYEAIDNAIV